MEHVGFCAKRSGTNAGRREIDRQEGRGHPLHPASADLISFQETHGESRSSSKLRLLDGTTWTCVDRIRQRHRVVHRRRPPHDAQEPARPRRLHDTWRQDPVIGECGHAYRIAKRLGPTASKNKNPFKTISIFNLADDYLQKGAFTFDKSKIQHSVTYHDPCNFARSTGIFEEPRRLLQAMVGDFREMTPNRTKNWCCGGGGGLAVMDGPEKVAKIEGTFLDSDASRKKKFEQIQATGAATSPHRAQTANASSCTDGSQQDRRQTVIFDPSWKRHDVTGAGPAALAPASLLAADRVAMARSRRHHR